MGLLRTALTIALIAGLAAWLLVRTAPTPPATLANIANVVVPVEVEVGQRVVVLGTVLVPDEGVLNLRLRQCHVESGRCVSVGRNRVTGPSTWTGTVGTLMADQVGAYRLEWTLYADWSFDSRRAAVRHMEEVSVRESTD